MLRDFKLMRRNSGKNPNSEEVENVPINPRDVINPQMYSDPSRPPLNAIQEPSRIPRGVSDQDLTSLRANKADKTPTKPKVRYTDASMPLRTPERHGLTSRSRFNWGPKSEIPSVNGGLEVREEIRAIANTTTPCSSRAMSRGGLSYSECNSTQSTPTKSVNKPPHPGSHLVGISKPMPNSGARLPNYNALSRGIPNSCNNTAAGVNNAEVPCFELKEDSSFWMEHNVQVLIRIRPMNNMEKNSFGFARCLRQESAQSITWTGPPETRFVFDHVACEAIDQETLFRMVGLPMVENCLSGYNSCMFAYGQTGSGKTYTMLGEIDELEVKPSPNRGMTPRIFEFLFARIRAEEESRRDEQLKYNCKCSFLEIYNEQITDLLDPSSTNLMLREDMQKGVYVENLSEFEVHTVGDILHLLTQGSLNRKVAATNMNRESSRSHSVFTCVIESQWVKDSTTNFRFARLNLVDLAGSERQKSSGAEGERLKEAANINKSLSTLGHVIMVLVDVAHGKQRHVPYRDSRLTFLLQDSLGGNSKTMIIANVSPSICSAAETLNTLKFAKRAKLIKNNAIINEDSSGDITALKNQIKLLKEELSAMKQQKVPRSLSFGPVSDAEVRYEDEDDRSSQESDGVLRMSCKQLKSLETTLAGSLRRERMAETSVKRLEGEIEQLKRLASQREEDARGIKMMLKFREDKIQRMESVLGGLMSADDYLLKENAELAEENQLLRARLDKNPEVTRFAVENIRLLEQVGRFQDFYEEGEREMLINEVSELRNQLFFILGENSRLTDHPDTAVALHSHEGYDNDSVRKEVETTLSELEECKRKLHTCLEENATLKGLIEELHVSMNEATAASDERNDNAEVIKESIVEVPACSHQSTPNSEREVEAGYVDLTKHGDNIVDLQLELDILKIILQEEKSRFAEMEQKTESLDNELSLSNKLVSSLTKDYEEMKEELNKAKLAINALESQQLFSVNEIDNLRSSNLHYEELLNEKVIEISCLKEENSTRELKDLPSVNGSGTKSSSSHLEAKIRRVQDSLEKAKKLNEMYQSDLTFKESNKEEMEQTQRQVEAETAEVIVCLQEQLFVLQRDVEDSKMREMETCEKLMSVRSEMKIMEDELRLKSTENEKLAEMLEDKEKLVRKLTQEFDLIDNEIASILSGGHEALNDACDQIEIISSSMRPQKSGSILEQFERMRKYISEKQSLTEKLNQSLKDAFDRSDDMERMVSSLRGAVLLMSETHEQECVEKDKEILLQKADLDDTRAAVVEMQTLVNHGKDRLQTSSSCAMAALVIVNRLSELNSEYSVALGNKDLQIREFQEIIDERDKMLQSQASVIDEAEKQNIFLRDELKASEECCAKLREVLEAKLEESKQEEIIETKEKLEELNSNLSSLKSCMNECVKQCGNPWRDEASEKSVDYATDKCQSLAGNRKVEGVNDADSCNHAASINEHIVTNKALPSKSSGDVTVALLRKEIESALTSLQEVQAEMGKLRKEKEEILASELKGRKKIESLMTQANLLQDAMDAFGSKVEMKFNNLEGKICEIERVDHESFASRLQQKELLEAELHDAKVVASQKTIEASCIFEKFVEVQETVKEADIMINELMIANEALKLHAHELKLKENNLINEINVLSNEVERLNLSNNIKDQNYGELQKQYDADFSILSMMLSELEDVVLEFKTTSTKEWMSVASEFYEVKSQVQKSTGFIRMLLEEVWSEIIAKDCAVSVFHLCHMGILLETANGLNAENGLLRYGLCKSNSTISELHENNTKAKRELEICSVLKGKLLEDIKKSFDRVSSKVDEAGEVVTLKLSSFEKKIKDLQFQEEAMLQRSNDMGSELATLMKELDLNSKQTFDSILDHEKLMKEKEELFQRQEEDFMMKFFSKEIEVLTLSTELKQMVRLKDDLESSCVGTLEVLEKFKKDIVCKCIDADASELILFDLESQNEKLLGDFKMKDATINTSSSLISDLYRQIRELQMLLEIKDEALGKMSCLEKENEELQVSLSESNAKNNLIVQELMNKKDDYESIVRGTHDLDSENHRLKNEISMLKNCIDMSEEGLRLAKAEIANHKLSHSVIRDKLFLKFFDLHMQLCDINILSEENIFLRNELRVRESKESIYLSVLNLRNLKNVDLIENMDKISCKMQCLIAERCNEVNHTFQKIVTEMERTNQFVELLEFLENVAMQFDSKVSHLQTELKRKDDVLNGLLFDLSLLQESASNCKDQKDEMEQVVACLRSLEHDLESKSCDFDKAVAECHAFEAQVREKTETIAAREGEIIKYRDAINTLSSKNDELLASTKNALEEKDFVNEKLIETMIRADNLEMEISDMETTLSRVTESAKLLESSLEAVTSSNQELENNVHNLTKELEMAKALAEQNEAIAIEAQEIAEHRKVQAEEKEEEVKLLERSIEELECTVNVLEKKVEIVKGDAEKQRLHREELELELLAVKEQMDNVKTNDTNVTRCLDEKEKKLHQALERVQLLEKEIASRDAEISQCKAHISELNLHAEAQACEYKQKFKTLEAMFEQVKSDASAVHSTSSSSNKSEKNASKPRGSGSPFKCIGIGLAQQIKSEKDEELSANRQRIEELEALAASRQKEIFMLNARLAATESMTHDVIRDLLGVKMNMNSYANLMDNEQLQTLLESAEPRNAEAQAKEVANLKQQINEFVKERNGWLEEIERKQAEVMAAHLALEKLRHHDQLLATENDILKMENANHKGRVMDLKEQVNKLSGQQNIHQRIHHHAKIKEENNLLRSQNEELSIRLRKTEAILSRVQEELARYRAANGKTAYINFDKELQLEKKLKETEEERLQLAQNLVGLCTTVLKAAGITRPSSSEISLSVAEDALEQLKSRVVTLEMELQDVKLKNRITEERLRLSELRPQTSPATSENCQLRTHSPHLSAFDR